MRERTIETKRRVVQTERITYNPLTPMSDQDRIFLKISVQ